MLAIRNCRQEKNPDGHPIGKDDLSCRGIFLTVFGLLLAVFARQKFSSLW
jgi:hypothetical protein